MTIPLTPQDCDLTDFDFMPMLINRLFASEFHALSDHEAWRAGVTLWLKSWHQVPAASLPNDDVQLARLAEYARDVKGWKKVKDAALRGWTLCEDGRLYHPVVAERALEAWLEKLTQRLSSGAGNQKRWGADFDPASVEAQQTETLALLKALNPLSNAIAKYHRRKSQRRPTGNPDGTPGGTPAVAVRESQVEVEGKGEVDIKNNTLSGARDFSKQVIDAAGEGLADPASCPSVNLTQSIIGLTSADPPCLPEEVLAAAQFAGLWHIANRGPRSMKSWKLACDKALELRDERLRPRPVNDVRPPPKTQSAAIRSGLAGLQVDENGVVQNVAR